MNHVPAPSTVGAFFPSSSSSSEPAELGGGTDVGNCNAKRGRAHICRQCTVLQFPPHNVCLPFSRMKRRMEGRKILQSARSLPPSLLAVSLNSANFPRRLSTRNPWKLATYMFMKYSSSRARLSQQQLLTLHKCFCVLLVTPPRLASPLKELSQIS